VAPSEGDTFRISGTVEEAETGRPLGALIVRAFDRDLLFDDKIGFATSDEEGRFEIRFRAEDFRDWRETRPDLYLRVYDLKGTALLYETTDAIRWKASTDEQYRLRIPARALRAAGGR
jgi:hypothetical protein